MARIPTQNKSNQGSAGIPAKTILLYDSDDMKISRFEQSDTRKEVLDRINLMPPSKITKIVYSAEELKLDINVMDTLDKIDRDRLNDRNILIDLKVKDMPAQVVFFGENIRIRCDYKKHEKPYLGDGVIFFPNSAVSFYQSPEETGFATTKLEQGAIIGANVHAPGLNINLGKDAILGDYNDFNSRGITLKEGAYIRSGYLFTDKDVKRVSDFYNTGPNNELGRFAEVSGNVLFTGHNLIPAYASVTDNVPLIFLGIQLARVYLKATGDL